MWLSTHSAQYFLVFASLAWSQSIMKSSVGTHVTFYELQVNNALMDLIKATGSAMKPEEWSAQPENTSETGALISARPITVTMRTDEGANAAVAVYNLLGKLQLSFLYLIGVIVMGFEHIRNIVRIMKPARVAPIDS
ncbi:alpha/beta-Hydrolases superfamily protein [Zea mays]|uniref:Alpha/beta-Hydrolases superfamily protein n=1 Tax=Zea mays TaxID=4577 RepID=A0A1D6FJB2_MAIZE|nr:alpha/beta-Hydrolases superfamily protein [Zea mays]